MLDYVWRYKYSYYYYIIIITWIKLSWHIFTVAKESIQLCIIWLTLSTIQTNWRLIATRIYRCLTMCSIVANSEMAIEANYYELTWHAASSVGTQHITGHFGNDFYRSDDQTNSVKALKETSWSSRSGFNLTRTTPPCYNNTTLATASMHSVRVPMWQTQSVWPVRTAHISVLRTVNIVSHNPAQSCSDNIHFNLQTITITQMLSSGGEGLTYRIIPPNSNGIIWHNLGCIIQGLVRNQSVHKLTSSCNLLHEIKKNIQKWDMHNTRCII